MIPRFSVIAFSCLCVFMLASCTPGSDEDESATATAMAVAAAPHLTGVVAFGSPEIRDLRPTKEVVSNCAGITEPVVKHPMFSLEGSHSVEWSFGSATGIGLQIGSDLLPAKVSLEEVLEGRVAQELTHGFQQGNAWDLPAEPGYIVTYEIMWHEVWQPGYVDATFLEPEPEILRIDVKYRTGVQSEIVGQTSVLCDDSLGAEATQPATGNSGAETVVSSTAVSRVSQFRLCNVDLGGDTFAQTDINSGVTRIEMLPPAQVFFISADPTTITFSPGSGLSPISSEGDAHLVILGRDVPGLEWIELNPGLRYSACIYSPDLFLGAKSEADHDMDVKEAGGNESAYYYIDQQDVELMRLFPTNVEGVGGQEMIARVEFEVFANLSWQDTGVIISLGDTVRVIWDGNSRWRGINSGDFSDPLGGFGDPNAEYACEPLLSAEEAGWNALVAKVGENGIVTNPFKVPPSGQGKLFMAMNDCDQQRYDNEGSVVVTIEVRR